VIFLRREYGRIAGVEEGFPVVASEVSLAIRHLHHHGRRAPVRRDLLPSEQVKRDDPDVALVVEELRGGPVFPDGGGSGG
jgi:hypothetical protein